MVHLLFEGDRFLSTMCAHFVISRGEFYLAHSGRDGTAVKDRIPAGREISCRGNSVKFHVKITVKRKEIRWRNETRRMKIRWKLY